MRIFIVASSSWIFFFLLHISQYVSYTSFCDLTNVINRSPKFPNYHHCLPYCVNTAHLPGQAIFHRLSLTTNMHPGTKCYGSTCPQAPFATIAASHVHATKRQNFLRQIQYYFYRSMRCMSTTWHSSTPHRQPRRIIPCWSRNYPTTSPVLARP